MAYNQYNQYQQSPHTPHPAPPNYGSPMSAHPPPPNNRYSQPPNQGYPPPNQGYPPQNYGAPAPPPNADPQLWAWFTAVDTDRSGQLTADELQRALVNGDFSPFNLETVRMMVNMFDTDNSGTIGFNEFAGLWRYIEDWKRCFQAFDADGSGSIDANEMRNALRTFGYNLSDRFVTVLIQKFDKYGNGGQSGKGDVTFDNFVQACVNVKTLTDSFRSFDTDGDGWIQISYEQFLELVIRQRA